MNIIVCIKETFDSQARILLDKNGDVNGQNVNFVINPYDEYAIEEAISLKERYGGTVKVVTASVDIPKRALYHCLALGADDAIVISDPALTQTDAHGIALVLSRYLKTIEFDIVFCGREAIDDGTSEIPSRLAALLDLPQVTVVSAMKVENGIIKARRDIEGGTELISIPLPCLLSAQKDLNIPRYPPMRRLLMAKKMPVTQLSFKDLSIGAEEVQPFVRVRKITLPEPRKAGEIYPGPIKESVEKLVSIITKKANQCQEF